MKRSVIALVLCFLGWNAAQPTAQLRDPKAPGTIRGRVTAADTGRPLRRVAISLRSATDVQQRPVATTSTNSRGEFEFAQIAAGTYTVSAVRSGYLALQYGQRRPNEGGLSIEVEPGATRTRVDVALPRGSVLAGRVVDETGAPALGVQVIALELRYQLGQRAPFPTGMSSTTDDLGQFRISGLPPGRFQIAAFPADVWRQANRQLVGYGATFFPGTIDANQAQAVTLGVADQRLDVDMQLRVHPAPSVRGRVLRSTGGPLANEAVSLARSLRAGVILTTGAMRARTNADGSFEFRGVMPGMYMVRATSPSEGTASATIVVADRPIDDVVLTPQLGSTVTGSVVTDEGGPPPFSASGVRVLLLAEADAPVLPTVRLPAVDNDWSLRMTSLGGPFVFRFTGLPATWMLDAVRLGERDITDVPWDVPSGQRTIGDLQMVITQKVGQVTGVVVDADDRPTANATVVIFAEDQGQWRVGSRFVRSTRPTVDGTFAISGLPAGAYLVVARDGVLDGEWESREFLARAAENAQRVRLEAGGQERVDLKTP